MFGAMYVRSSVDRWDALTHYQTLEMFHQRSGYRAGEAVASHGRRRYRLLPNNPTMPSPDPALFIVHYSKAHGRDTIPAASIPVVPHIAQQINQRRAIQAQGQLARKDFMLHDRSNWPQISAPQGMARAGPGHRRATSLVNETTVEEEEDVSRGDILDFMTPRDISRLRYEQHHEWMEEVLESPYNIHQIVPSDLGMGRKGELEELTKDFFDAPTTTTRETSAGAEPSIVGKMDFDKAEDFRSRASRKIVAMQAEIDQMKAKHAKRMAKMQRTTVLNSSERRLRTAPTASSGRAMSSGSVTDNQDVDVIDEIASEVESSMRKKIERVSHVALVTKGGLQERHVERTFSTSSATRPVMSPVKPIASPVISQSAYLQQAHNSVQQQPTQHNPQIQATVSRESNSSSEAASTREQTQEARPVSEEKTPADNAGTTDADLPPLDDIGMDVDMEALVNDPDEENQISAANDWVMVDDQGEQNQARIMQADVAAAQPEDILQGSKGVEDMTTTQAQPPAQTHTFDQQPDEPQMDDDGFGGDFDNVDVDTAGDALASYGDDEDLNLDVVDDSAFGDAFHPEPDEDGDIS